AFDAGIVNGAQVVAVNGETYSEERIKRAITAAKDGDAPIRLLVKRGDRFLEVAVPYSGGLRYPWLERVGEREAGLDRLLEARTSGEKLPAGGAGDRRRRRWWRGFSADAACGGLPPPSFASRMPPPR